MALPRRTFLRGVGATLALPFLDAMTPALAALARPAQAPTQRLGFVYVPNGIQLQNYLPPAEGTSFGITPGFASTRELSGPDGRWSRVSPITKATPWTEAVAPTRARRQRG